MTKDHCILEAVNLQEEAAKPKGKHSTNGKNAEQQRQRKKRNKVCHLLFHEYNHIKTYEQYDIILLYSDIKGFIWDVSGQ